MRRTSIVTVLVAVALAVPLSVFASHQFTDVPSSNQFHNSIDWMKDNGITVGCNPPANTRYCPNDNVTRGQMAAFMKRLAENQVVDAGLLDSLPATAYANPVVNAVDGFIDLQPNALAKIGQLGITTPADGGLVLQAQIAPHTGLASSLSFYWLQVDNTTCAPALYNSIDWGSLYLDSTGNATSGSVLGMALVDAGPHTATLCIELASGQLQVSTSLVATYTSNATRTGTLSP
jgi:hypothetical protein